MTKPKQLQLFTPPPPTPEHFWKKLFSPMLAYNKEFDLKDVRLPCYVSEKIDGIRCIIHDGGIPRTRDNKMIPNDFIRNTITAAKLPAGFDGEIVTLRVDRTRKNFHSIQSDVMSTDGEPDFEYLVFDFVNEHYHTASFDSRIQLAFDWFRNNNCYNPPFSLVKYPWFKLLCPEWCETDKQFNDAVEVYISTFKDKYEGCIIRSAHGKYKFGRSTFNEQYLLKVTPWRRDEAIIVGTEEEMINDNTATYEKSNLRPANSLGALVVKWEGCQETFRIGSGFTREERNQLWDTRNSIVGKKVTFKYKPYGTKDAPRTPIFVGIRLERE